MSEQDSTNISEISTIRNNLKEYIQKIAEWNQNQITPNVESEKDSLNFIPFLPIELNTYELNHLWPLFGNLFVNLEGGILIFLTDSKLVPEEAYFLKLNDRGNVTQLIEIELNQIPVQIQGNVALDENFDRLKSWIKTQYNADLGNLILISNQIIDELLKIHQIKTQDPQSTDLLGLIAEYFVLISQSYSNNEIAIYPVPRILHFIQSISHMITNINRKDFVNLLKELLPEVQSTLSFQLNQIVIPFKLKIQNGNILLNRIAMDKDTPNLNEMYKFRKEWLKRIRLQEKCPQNLIIDLNAAHQILVDVFESDYPLTPNRFKLLLQKIIFGYKSRGELWDLDPWPLIYYPMFRFITYILGYRVNLNKLSHWSIPETMEIFSSKVFGMNAHLILLLGEDLDFSQVITDQSKNTIQAYSIEIRNRSISKIEAISSEIMEKLNHTQREIAVKEQEGQLAQNKQQKIKNVDIQQILTNFRIQLTNEIGFVDSVLFARKSLLKAFSHDLYTELLGRRVPPLLKLKKYQKQINAGGICIVPQNKYFDQDEFKKPDKILKLIIALLVDQREY